MGILFTFLLLGEYVDIDCFQNSKKYSTQRTNDSLQSIITGMRRDTLINKLLTDNSFRMRVMIADKMTDRQLIQILNSQK